VVAGRIVYLAEAWRLSRSAAPRPLSA
jgi:hypothetical protein